MSSFHNMVMETMTEFKNWHDEAHTLQWHDCPYPPCSRVRPEVRGSWR